MTGWGLAHWSPQIGEAGADELGLSDDSSKGSNGPEGLPNEAEKILPWRSLFC